MYHSYYRSRTETWTATNVTSTDSGCTCVYWGNDSGYSHTLEPLPVVATPKNWRWFHAWALPVMARVLPLLDGIPEAIRRAQERFPNVQRMRRKRRAFLHTLRMQ